MSRERLTDLGYALGWRVARAVPPGLAGATFRLGADLAVRRNGAGVRQLRANLARVLAADSAEHSRSIRANGMGEALDALVVTGMRSYARYWCEAFRLPAMNPAAVRDRTSIAGLEHVERGLADGRGVVLALPHSGNWDVAGVWLVETLRRWGEPAGFCTVVERLRPDSLYRRFVAYRESLGFEVLPADGGARTLGTLATRLRANRVVCLIADRELGTGGVAVDFFGEPARMPGGPAHLARRTGAALLPVGSWFTPDGWEFRVYPPIEPPAAPAGPAVRAMTQALADTFAAEIAAHPADWHMLQPIWAADRVRAEVAVAELAR